MPRRRTRPSTFFDFIRGLKGEEQVENLLLSLSREALLSTEHSWRSWGHDGQQTPEIEDWRTWVIMAGRGYGKTRAGAEWIKAHIAGGAPLRIALVAANIDEARRIMIEGKSGLLAVAKPYIDRWQPSGPTLYFDGGAQATLYSGANPDGLRGPEHDIAWCDELAKWEKAEETWDNLQLGMRLGDRPRVLVTTTPRPGPVLKRIMDAKGTVTTGGHTRHNIHLPEAFVEAVEEMYGGTRLGRQELEGELLSDTPGALWSEALLERCRLNPPRACLGEVAGRSPDGGALYRNQPLHHPTGGPPPRGKLGEDFVRTVIGVDPPTGPGTCGIVACAKDEHGHLHVLADHSIAGGPAIWAAKVAAAAEAHDAAYVVAETNQGGAMVGEVLKSANAALSVRPVTANLGKSARATPVATRFEAGKAWIHGRWPELEAELCGLIEGGGYEPPWKAGEDRSAKSPDRADAMVWAMTDLMGKEKAGPRVRRL